MYMLENISSETIGARKGPSQKEKVRRLCFDIPLSLHKQLKIVSAQNSVTMGSILLESVREFMKKESNI